FARSVTEPTTRKSGFFQSRDDVRIGSHRPPDQIRSIVLDHGDDRALIDPQIISIEPTESGRDATVLRRAAHQRRIEIIDESIGRKKIVAVFLAHSYQRG